MLGGVFEQNGASYAASTSVPSAPLGTEGARSNIPIVPIKIDITRGTLSDNEERLFGKLENGGVVQGSHVEV